MKESLKKKYTLFFPEDKMSDGHGYQRLLFSPSIRVRPLAQILSVEEQLQVLEVLFPQIPLGYAREWSWEMLPQYKGITGLDGWLAIPWWKVFARTYGEALRVLVSRIEECGVRVLLGTFKLEVPHLRRQERVDALFKEVSSFQICDVKLLLGQLGRLYQGTAVNEVHRLLDPDEAAMGVFEGLWCAFLHRFWPECHIDCPGDTYSPYPENTLVYSPYVTIKARDLLLVRYRRSDKGIYCCGTGSLIRPRR